LATIVIHNSKFGDSAVVELTSLNGTCKTILKTTLFQNYPIADFGIDSIVCAGSPAHFTDKSVSGIEHWYWDFGDGTTDMTQNPVHSYAAKGIYTIRLAVQNTDGCTDTVLLNISVCPGLGIDDHGQLPALHVYPNPSTGLFTMEALGATNGAIQIEISDLLGRLVYSEKNTSKNGSLQKELDIKEQPDGIYFLTIKHQGYSKVMKLIKKN
jgi:PKD repeat protein